MADFSRLPGPNADLWDWQLLAACRGVDSSLFFHPEGERGAARSAREASAKEVCMRCPVRAECAAHALQVREPYGVWGGLTEDEREELLGRARSRLVAAPHDRRAETTPGPGGAAPAPTPEPANPFGAPERTGGSERRDEPDPAPDADERFDDAAAMDTAERFDDAEPLDGDEPFDELERFEQRERFDAADRYGRTEPVGER